MERFKWFLLVVVILFSLLSILSGCADTGKDYEAVAYCGSVGYKAGTEEYESCLKQERARRMLEQQRRDSEQIKQNRRDWKMQRH